MQPLAEELSLNLIDYRAPCFCFITVCPKKHSGLPLTDDQRCMNGEMEFKVVYQPTYIVKKMSCNVSDMPRHGCGATGTEIARTMLIHRKVNE